MQNGLKMRPFSPGRADMFIETSSKAIFYTRRKVFCESFFAQSLDFIEVCEYSHSQTSFLWV
jgi:hypothetical protein